MLLHEMDPYNTHIISKLLNLWSNICENKLYASFHHYTVVRYKMAFKMAAKIVYLNMKVTQNTLPLFLNYAQGHKNGKLKQLQH